MKARTVLFSLLLAGCFDDTGDTSGADGGSGDGSDGSDDGGDGSGDDGGSGSGDDGGSSGDDGGSSGDDGGSSSDDGGTTSGDDGGTTSGDGGTTTSSSVPLGPQIVDSVPASGDQFAGLNGYFFLFFDRPVAVGDATGKFLASQGGAAAVPVVVMNCPNADPTCLAGIYPEDFSDGNGRLPGGVPHEITVTADFPDPQGITNTEDQIVTFRTFPYNPNFFDDSQTLATETGGIAYDPVSEALFVVGLGDYADDGPTIRKIPIPGGSPQPAITVAQLTPPGGGPYTYGMDRYGGQLLVCLSYGSQVAVMSGMNANNLVTDEVIENPPLAAPYDNLDEVWSAAKSLADNRWFFAFGDFFGGSNRYGIVQRTGEGPGAQWEIFEDGDNLWNQSQDGVVITVGMLEGTNTLFAHAENVIYTFRLADGILLGEFPLDTETWTRQMILDDVNRLWLGSDDGIFVYDATGGQLNLIDQRAGLHAARIALRPEGNTMHVYYVPYRDAAIIGHVHFEF